MAFEALRQWAGDSGVCSLADFAASCPFEHSLSRRSGDRQSRHLGQPQPQALRAEAGALHSISWQSIAKFSLPQMEHCMDDPDGPGRGTCRRGHRAAGRWPPCVRLASGGALPVPANMALRRIRIRIGPGPEPEARAAGSESKSAKQPKLSCAQLRGPCPLLIMLPGSGVEARQHGLEGWGGAFILWNVQEDGDVQMLPLLWLGVLRWGVAITGNLIIPNASSDGMCCRRQAATQCFVVFFVG